MRVSALVLILFAMFAGGAMAECITIPEEKKVIRFDSKLGDVTFAHKKHADLSITKCTTCHHKHQPSDLVMQPCHECHKHKAGESDPPKTKTALHTRCIGCHEYTIASGVPAGPVKNKCKLCHVK